MGLERLATRDQMIKGPMCMQREARRETWYSTFMSSVLQQRREEVRGKFLSYQLADQPVAHLQPANRQ